MVLSENFSNFAVENRAEELAQSSEKVLFELSSFSKFSQNSLIDSKISADNAYIGSIYLPLKGYLYSFSVWVCCSIHYLRQMREAY